MSAKPMFLVGVFGLDVRDVRLIEIVFKHSQYNKYEFKRSESADAAQADLLVLNTADPAGLAALNSISNSQKNIPVIAVVSRGSQTSARHAISIDRLTLQLLPILNRVVELELDTNGPDTLPMADAYSSREQFHDQRENLTNWAARLDLPSTPSTSEPTLSVHPAKAASDFVDLRILNEALKAAEPLPKAPVPNQFPELDANTRQMPEVPGPVDNLEARLASPMASKPDSVPTAKSIYQGAPLDVAAAQAAQAAQQAAAHAKLRPVEAAAPAAEKKVVKLPGAEYAGKTQRLKAMIVDDSPTVRSQLTSALNRMGMFAEAFSSARQALDSLESTHFDIALVDVVMPEMDGYKLTKEIKRNKSLRGMPVVILTSKSSPFDLARGALAGCDTYLSKPVPLKQLEAALVKQLRKSLAIDDLSALLRLSTNKPSDAQGVRAEAKTA